MQEVAYLSVASPAGDMLIEHALRSGNAGDVAARLLGRLPERRGSGSGRRSYSMGGEGFTFRLAWGPSGYVFVCMERGLHEQAVWQLLGSVKKRFEAQYFGASGKPVTMQAAAPFASVLGELADGVNRSGIVGDGGGGSGGGRLGSVADQELVDVNDKLKHVKDVMADSIEKVLERGERIDVLVDRAERLETNAVKFAKGSGQLRRTMAWRSRRCYVLAVLACALGCVGLAMGFCGGVTLRECREDLTLGASIAASVVPGGGGGGGGGAAPDGFARVSK